MVRGVLLDLSGVLYVGGEALSGARDALARLRQEQVPVRYVTNTSRSPAQTILDKLTRLGFQIAPEALFTAPMAARAYVQQRGLSPWLLVHPALLSDVGDLAGEHADAVLIGDAGEGFHYAALNRAFRLLMDGAPLIAMGRNRYFRETDGLSLDAGPFVTALEYATDTEAVVTGKPAPEFFHAACAHLSCQPNEVAMVGDDVEADVNGASRAGLQGILVRTGKYQQGDDARLEDPQAVCVDDLAAAVDWLLAAK